jgi:hypothetical protein
MAGAFKPFYLVQSFMGTRSLDAYVPLFRRNMENYFKKRVKKY